MSGKEPELVEVSALDVLVRCARESFDVKQLRYLSRQFEEMAGEKELAEALASERGRS